MRVPAIIYASEGLVRDMDDKVSDQLQNVASLPGIVRAAYAMPDAHWGYGVNRHAILTPDRRASLTPYIDGCSSAVAVAAERSDAA